MKLNFKNVICKMDTNLCPPHMYKCTQVFFLNIYRLRYFPYFTTIIYIFFLLIGDVIFDGDLLKLKRVVPSRSYITLINLLFLFFFLWPSLVARRIRYHWFVKVISYGRCQIDNRHSSEARTVYLIDPRIGRHRWMKTVQYSAIENMSKYMYVPSLPMKISVTELNIYT